MQLPPHILGPIPPAILTLDSGRYLVGGDKWYPVDSSFTFEDAQKLWQRQTYVKPISQDTITFRVESSKPGKWYTVSNGPSGWSCTCTGFGYRRDCKHVRAKKGE